MYASTVLLTLAATTMASASAIDARHFGVLDVRSVAQGWSLQASTCPSDSTTCSSGGCCPSTLTCNAAASDEVAACCSDGDCRGSVEGAPTCADSSWSLYKGLNGNGFCCEVGQVGVMDYTSGSMSCVAKGSVGSSSTAELVSTGSGSAKTSAAAAASTTASEAKATSSAKAGSTSGAASKASATSSASSPSATSSGSSSSVVSSVASSKATSKTSATTTGSRTSSNRASTGTSSATSANASSTGSANGAGQLTVGLASVFTGLLAVLAL